ncbi:MAG: alanine racemase [Metallibacterium scheffleri]|uniref:alanine racemase n=1 Tax=Metallibacterium scheffleri TaxID=993689 RepID=UPI0026EF02E4|nr:alanine racemase [Metallibacterium scheffleri]MCK9366855.1 alanine racemase [Metallibacterium scheffleri]
MSRLAVASIDLAALTANLTRLRALAAPARLMAVVKADGYGHGLERVARALAGADAFGVAAIADGQRLRAAGHAERIVVLSGPDAPGDLAELRRLDLDAVIHHPSQLEWLEAEAGGAPLRVWLKVDSGMHRLGFAPARVAEVHARLRQLSQVHPEIVLMTHFAASDEFGNALTAQQTEAFAAATRGLPGPRSLSNSAALLGWPAARGDWVRAGGLLYGLSVVRGKTGADHGVVPAMRLATRLIAVNRVAQGEAIGYAGTWRCPEAMPVGIAAIGYGDGYPRSAPSGTPALLREREVALIGRVSMDLLALDLRAVPDARVGDEVVLWGPDLPVEHIAAAAGTISYELTCGVTRRVLFVER